MTDLKPLPPLGGETARIEVIGKLTITENTNSALASLAARTGQRDQVVSAILDAYDLDLPGPGGAVGSATHRAWWIGPDQWMIEADFALHEALPSEATQAVGGAGSVTEQSDAWCRFDIIGDGIADLLERLCPVDVRTMKAPAATRTVIHHLGCFLVRQHEQWTIYGPRSSAGSLHHALTAAAHSIAELP